MLREDRHLVHVLDVRRVSKLSPLSGWPADFPAWVPELWHDLEAEIERRRETEARRREA